ncbi:MAG: hypothetical protein PF487_06685 [Bacteroidales bacterium]|nr:hypothetical protein [Bacteroidales bacterium]
MNRFYFNTGVKPNNSVNSKYVSKFPFEYHKKIGNVIRGGVLQCPFDCDAPKNAKLMFLCNNPELDEGKAENVIVREVFNTSMSSKYAYLRILK